MYTIIILIIENMEYCMNFKAARLLYTVWLDTKYGTQVIQK